VILARIGVLEAAGMSYEKNLAAVVWIVALIPQGIFMGCATRQLPSKKEIAVSPEVGFPPEVVAKVNAGDSFRRRRR